MKLQFTNKLKKRIAVGFLAVLLCLSTAFTSVTSASGSGVSSQLRERVVSFKNVTGEVDLSKIKLDNLSDYVMANVDTSKYEERAVIVSLKSDSLSQSAGNTNITDYISSQNGQRQKNKIDGEQKEFLSDLKARGVEYDLITDYDTVLNGVAIKVNTAYVSLIKLLPNVESVVISETYALPQTVTDGGSSAADITNQTSVYQTGIYDSSKYASVYGGKGMVVAVLDTGLDYTHEAFQAQPDQSSMKYTEDDIYGMVNDPEKDFSATGEVFVSNKVPFAYDYADRDADVYPSYSNHGTHVAGIIGGSADSYTDKDGFVPTDENGDPVPFRSVAPNSQLVICKVFTDDLDSKSVGGAETQDILDALDDCVKLGVDVINMSLGTTCGFSSTNDGDLEGELMHQTYQSIQDAGISLICAASNDYSSAYGGPFGTNLTSNPDSGTVGSPSTFAAALSVASISGKKSPFVLANADSEKHSKAVFYNESSDENNVDYDFAELMLGGKTSGTFKYVVIRGSSYGSNADYNTSYVKKAIASAHSSGEKIIVLVKRGGNLTFQEKVENAIKANADAIIVYNNVAGEIKMTIGDVDEPIPAISISYEAGEALIAGAKDNIGTVTINPSAYQAGPFMSNFSSWGATSDLKLKPEITAHGGEITSSVPGGWDEQSGTSMATPNVAGLVANVRSYITAEWSKFFDEKPTSTQVTQLTNQLMMSTATVVVDQEALPYSPRKQGAGLASLENIIDKANAYLYTVSGDSVSSEHGNYFGAEDDRPKIELGEDEKKTGKYTLQFYVKNVSAGEMQFTINSLFMTETVSLDGLAVGEQAYMLGGNAVWTVDGLSGTYKDGDTVSIKSGSTKISVSLTLSKQEKAYLDKNFKNGMYVEGFLQLKSENNAQCDLSLPFLGFYGDWDSAPMLDYDAFEISKIEQDTSLLEDEKPKASVWATQAYSIYWNDKYVLPMGSFVYKQNDDDDEVRKIYTTEEYSSISCYNEYVDEDSNNYMTSTGIKGIYAGLLRNAKQVDCRMYNVQTGELIYSKEIYRVNKAYSGGASTTPGYVKLELTPAELGLVENGQYRMEFDFHYKAPDENTVVNPENTFNFSFYVDYTAPVLEEARIRYHDYKDGNKEKQDIYLDLDVYDNHYSMAALLCYLDTTDETNPALQLCTDYVTPIYDSKKNGTTTVSIKITDIIEKYGDNLYVELDDYALNHSVYQINVSDAAKLPLPNSFDLADGEDQITLGKYEKHKVELVWDKDLYPNANLSNFTWTVTGKSTSIVAVKNGEIVGLAEGEGVVTVTNGRISKEINVKVVEGNQSLKNPSISFDVILNDVKAPVKAQGVVDVNISQDIRLEVMTDPWYYPLVGSLDLEWSSSDETVGTVDQDGNVKLLKKGKTSIIATIKDTAYSATVLLNVQEPFKVSNFSLTGYEGAGGVVYIPTDMNIMTIGENAFKNNENVTAVIIPKTVTTIDARAFYGCKNLKYVFFVDVVTQEIAEADLTLINWEAFSGCTSLEFIDFSNCKTFTVASRAFLNCTSLKFIKGIEHIGTAYNNAFTNCSSLIGSISSQSGVILVNPDSTKWDDMTNRITDIEVLPFENLKDADGNALKITSLDVSGLHVAGSYVFQGCSQIVDVTTAQFTAIGVGMFSNCKGLTNVTLKDVSSIGAYAFEKCFGLKSVSFEAQGLTVGEGAFSNSGNLNDLDFTNATVTAIEARAFANTGLKSFTVPDGIARIGDEILYGTDVSSVTFPSGVLENVEFSGNPFKGMTISVEGQSQSQIVLSGDGKKLIYVNANADLTNVTIPETVEEIGAYSFAGLGVKNITIPSSVKIIGNGAFKNSSLESITFETGSVLDTIGREAFYGVRINAIAIPSTVKSVGDYAFAYSPISGFSLVGGSEIIFGDGVFAGCSSLVEIDLSEADIVEMGTSTFANAVSLTTVKLSSLKALGRFTFMGATNVKEVIFGENSTTTGEYTFFTYSYNGAVTPYEKLTSVTIGNDVEKIGSNAFVGCIALESIDLKNATIVEDLAFYGASSLKEVVGLENVKSVGMYSFWNTASLRSLNLDSVIDVGIGAFRIERTAGESALTATINMPKVETIGAYAFYGTGAVSVSLPSTICEIQQNDVYNIDGVAYGQRENGPIGVGVFANAPNLSEITVDGNNPTYFDDGGVLYRYVTDKTYELVSYPTARKAIDFTVKQGTVRIEAYAFAGSKVLTNVNIPYSVVTIGQGAFFDSLVDTYTFDGHIAPVLESEFDETLKEYIRADISFRGMFNNNFVDYVIEYTDEISSIAGGNVSTLTMTYPKNGVGYESYVYRKYFTTRKQGEHVLTNDARTVKENLESISVDAVSAWLDVSFAVNDENKQTVIDFASLIKETHRLYNNVSNDKNQCDLINGGNDNVDKLFEIEEILRQVKEKFSITNKVMGYSFGGNYKKNYVEGETFDLAGLVITIEYDDYSTEEFSGSALKLADASKAPLISLDRTVKIECNGQTFSVDVRVSEGEKVDDSTPEKNNAWIFILIGAIVVFGGGVVVFVVISNKKKSANDQAENKAPVDEAEEITFKDEKEEE